MSVHTNTHSWTIGSLFSGIGGLELGLERAGFGPVLWQVEKDEWRRGVLAKHWPNAKRSDDIKTFYSVVRNGGYDQVDLICGGFPCQDVSQAARGRNEGLAGERSGLWRYFAGVISLLGPTCVVVENVASGKRRWLSQVRQDLHVLGYHSTAIEVAATDVGAPHSRKRIFVVAYAYPYSELARALDEEVALVPAHAGAMWNGWVSEPGSLRMANGIPNGLDRVRALGDAVVPQCAELVGRMIRNVCEGE